MKSIPSTLVLAITVALALPALAQLPDDKHWFYEYGGPSSEAFVLTVQGKYVYAGGLFLNVEGDSTQKNFSRFNMETEAWERISGVTSNFAGGIWDILAADDGLLYLGGNISNTGGTVSSDIVSFDPVTQTYGALTDPSPTLVTTGQANGPTNGRVLAIAKSGNLIYAGGEFTGPAGSPQNEKYIRSFNLTTKQWSRLGTGLDGDVRCLTVLPNGNLIAGGSFTGGLSRWNGSTWSVIGGGITGGFGGVPSVRAIEISPDGVLYVAGDFDTVGAGGGAVTVRDVAAWNNTAWSGLAGGFDATYIQSNGTTFDSNGVYALALDQNGVLYAAGDFDASNGRSVLNLRHIAAWDGSGAWKPMGSGVGTTGSQIVNALAIGPRGDVYATGVFNIGYGGLGAAAKNFARWLPTRDFTGYIPGVVDNPTSRVDYIDSGSRDVTLQTRPGTTYLIEASGDLTSWAAIGDTTFSGNGNRQGFNLSGAAERRFYRFRATGY